MRRRVWEAADGRAGLAALFAVALGAYWLGALAWPLQRGRDSWDYWLYYLQLADAHPPFSQLMLFRTPLAPIVTGLPMSLGGAQLLEVVLSLVYAASIAGWAWAARPFGRAAAVVTAAAVLVLLPYAELSHEVSSDFLFGALLAPWTGLLLRTAIRPRTSTLLAAGLLTAVLTLTRPAGQVLVLVAAAAALVAAGSWRTRGLRLAVAVAAAVVPLVLWAGVNAIRYDDFTVARGGKAWVPFFKVLGLREIDPANGSASRRLGDAIERDVLSLPPYRRLHVSLHTYLRSPSNFEAIRLIALSDRDFGRSSNYDVLYDSALEGIRKRPGPYARSVANTFWHFLRFRFSLGRVRQGPQPAPRQPAVVTVDGRPRPSPEAVSPMAQAARYGFVWCPTEAFDRCVFRHPEAVFGSASAGRRYVELVGRVRDWNAQLPLRDGVDFLTAKLGTLSSDVPPPALWLVVAVAGVALRRPRGWPALLVPVGAALLVLFLHALSQEPQAEFSIPFSPVFALAAAAAFLAPRRGATVPGS